MEQVEAQETTQEDAKQDICVESIGQDNAAEVEEDEKKGDNQEHESEGDNSPSEELLDDFFTEEFLEGLDVVDSWMDEEDECGEENQERNNGDKSTTNSSRHAGSKVSDGTVKNNSTTRQDNRKANSSGKKDERNNLKGKSAKERRSPHREDGRSRGRGSERQRNERSSDRKDSGVTSREKSSEKRDGSHTRRAGSLGKKDERRSLRDKSLERTLAEGGKEKKSRPEKERARSPEKRSRNESSSSHREGKVDKREVARKGDRVLHREKSSERKSSSSRLDDRSKRDRSRDRKISKRSTHQDSLAQSDRRKVDRKHPQAPDKNQNKQKSVLDKGNKQEVDNISGNKTKAPGNDPVQVITSTNVKNKLEVAAVENAPQGKAVAEVSFPKQLPPIALNEPIPPGTESDYLIVETIPDVKPDITAMSENDITSKPEKEDPMSSEKNAKKRESNKKDKIKSRSPSAKRSRRRSKSRSSHKSNDSSLEKILERNKLINEELEIRRKKQWDRRERDRRRRLLELGSRRRRSREKGEKRDRSYDRDRHSNDSKKLSRPDSPEVYRRLSSPRPSLQPGRVSLGRTRSLSRERKESGRHSRRLHRSSLSPSSISDSSLTLTSESEYERSKLQYIDSPRKQKRKQNKKPTFLKELEGILAARSNKGLNQIPQPAYPGGQQNAPHLEVGPHPGIYAPNLNDGLVLPINYPPPSFKPVGSTPAGYPVGAYPEHLTGPSTAIHPCPPTNGLPPSDFAFTLHAHPPGVPLPVPPPVAGVEIVHHPQVGPPPQVMNSPVIPTPFSFVSSSTPTAPPPPVISDKLAYAEKQRSQSSVLEASQKVAKQQIGVLKEPIIHHCEQAMQILKANDQLLMGSCFTFTTVLQSSPDPAPAHRSPLVSGKNVTYGFARHPEPKKPKSTSTASRMKTMLSRFSGTAHPIPGPARSANYGLSLEQEQSKKTLEQEQSKKTFTDSSVQTNEVILRSVATQSDYIPCGDSDLRVLNKPRDAFQAEGRIRIGGDQDDENFLKSMRREELSIDNKRPYSYGRSVNSGPDRTSQIGGNFVPKSHSPGMIHPPFKTFLPESHHSPALRPHIPDSSSLRKPFTREDFPMMCKPMSLDLQASDFRSRFSSSGNLPSSGMPLQGILKSHQLSTSDMYLSRPRESPSVLKSRDVWSRLEPRSSSGFQYGSNREQSSTSRYSPVPEGMTPEEYQRFFKE